MSVRLGNNIIAGAGGGGGGGAVDSVNGKTGVVVLDASDVGALPDSTSIPTESTVSGWGFTKNEGTVTSVNNVQPTNGNVTLNIPTVNDSTITVTQGGVTKGTFTLNQANASTIALDAGAPGNYHPDLFDYKWADHICNDVQWLRADTFSWQSGAVYQAAYQHLTTDITGKTLQSETISGTTIQFYLADDGHKICPASEESNVTAIYNAIDVAWYYIIDTTNQRFKLPRAKPLTGGVIGNGMTLGLTNGVLNGGLQTWNANSLCVYTENYGTAVNTQKNSGGTLINDSNYASLGLAEDATSSGIIAERDNTDQYKYLYFYVGEFTQTALENTAGLNTELFDGKADLNLANVLANIDFVVERQEPTAENNYTWYRKYRSGWVEQGGVEIASGTMITLPIAMANTKYTVQTTPTWGTADSSGTRGMCSFLKTTTSFKAQQDNNSGSFDWQVSGMAAQ